MDSTALAGFAIHDIVISELRDPFQSSTFVTALLAFCAIYHYLAGLYTTPKQLSWILTAVASATMTLVSIPFVWDYVSSGGDVKSVRTFSMLAYMTTRIFQAYLVADLMMGAIYYRSQVALVTGWIHHTLYVFIVQVTIKRAWTHIFCLCALMELPTFILAISSLYPRLRSNVTFAVTFFATRIMFHIILCISYIIPDNRLHATGGSVLPSVLLAAIFPLHALWFKGCVKGFLKRHKEYHAAAAQPVTLDVVSPTFTMQYTDQLLPQSSAPLYVAFRPAVQNCVAPEDYPPRMINRFKRSASHSWLSRENIYDFVGLGRHMSLSSSRGSM
jgi:hypothetical protein